mmetsp:Transcript_68940/g.165450  ORF Transcript_68940/g.165450 Transcript_68940/m.165450 type:complete len:304 (-) Transcript_68940:76-987(-)
MSESDSVGISAESQTESREPTKGIDDFVEYSRSLGVAGLLAKDPDLMWVVQQAFQAPLPRSWIEYVDDEGRVYFFNMVTEQSTWEHPMDTVYRELIDLIVRLRQEVPQPPEERRKSVVSDHLLQAHAKALEQMAYWSGPYLSDTGSYYYNEQLRVSTWVSPVEDMEYELLIRQSVLYHCLLADLYSSPEAAGTTKARVPPQALLPELQLPLREAHHADAGYPDESQFSSRSFHTAKESSRSCTSRSVGSARSGRSVAEVPGRGKTTARVDQMAKTESTTSEGNALEVTFGCTEPLQVPVMELR